jgi:hypothetical protein
MLEEILRKLGFVPENVIESNKEEFDNVLSSIPNIQDHWGMIDDLRIYKNHIKTMKYYIQTMEDNNVYVEKTISRRNNK